MTLGVEKVESDTERLFPGKVKGWGLAVSLRASVNVGFTLNTFPTPNVKNLIDFTELHITPRNELQKIPNAARRWIWSYYLYIHNKDNY